MEISTETENVPEQFISFIKENLDNDELLIFANSFFMYLKYDQTNDFVIDFDNVWKFIGFSTKANSKKLLNKHLQENIDYKIVFIQLDENLKLGGRPNETIMLNVRAFKKLCLKANTSKSDEIHDYYIKLEELNFKYIFMEKERMICQERENMLLNQIEPGTSGDYMLVDKVKKLMKCGQGHDLLKRIKTQKGVFKGFFLDRFFKTDKHIQLEQTIRPYFNTTYNGHREMVKYENYEEIEAIYKTVENECKLLKYKESNKLENRKIDLELKKLEVESKKIELENRKIDLESKKIEKQDNIKPVQLTQNEKTVKEILLENYEIGGNKDFVKLKDIKLLLKNNDIKNKDIITIKYLVEETFEQVEFFDKKQINKKNERSLFLRLKHI